MAAYIGATWENAAPRRTIQRIRQNQFENLPADAAMRDYRLPPYLIYDLVDELDPDLAPIRDDGRSITTLQKVLTNFRVLGSGSFQYASKDCINIAQPTVSKVLEQFITSMLPNASNTKGRR